MRPSLKTLAALTVAAIGIGSASNATMILRPPVGGSDPYLYFGTDASARIHPRGWSRRKRLFKIRAAYGGFVPRQYL